MRRLKQTFGRINFWKLILLLFFIRLTVDESEKCEPFYHRNHRIPHIYTRNSICFLVITTLDELKTFYLNQFLHVFRLQLLNYSTESGKRFIKINNYNKHEVFRLLHKIMEKRAQT